MKLRLFGRCSPFVTPTTRMWVVFTILSLISNVHLPCTPISMYRNRRFVYNTNSSIPSRVSFVQRIFHARLSRLCEKCAMLYKKCIWSTEDCAYARRGRLHCGLLLISIDFCLVECQMEMRTELIIELCLCVTRNFHFWGLIFIVFFYHCKRLSYKGLSTE